MKNEGGGSQDNSIYISRVGEVGIGKIARVTEIVAVERGLVLVEPVQQAPSYDSNPSSFSAMNHTNRNVCAQGDRCSIRLPIVLEG